MSFKCQVCGKAQEPREKPKKVVTQIRSVQYPYVKDVSGNIRIPSGYETVKEINCCQNCYSTRVFQESYVACKVLE